MIGFVIAVSAALAIAAIVEYRLHLARLRKIPVRVLVNGTRGKSTVTRLIAAGLRAGGVRVCAKTTGSAARLILPDGMETPLRERGLAKGRVSIMEHRAFVRRARAEEAEAVVAECMAIQPETIRVLETRLAHSTIGVITNVRLDHMDTMGPDLESVAEALSESVPARGRLFVGADDMDEPVKEIFRRAAAQRGAELHFVVTGADTQALCGKFAYPVFAQNLALAREVCGACGVEGEVALRGMMGATADPGVLASVQVECEERTVRVINAFAANDVRSTLEMWNRERVDFEKQHDNAAVSRTTKVVGHDAKKSLSSGACGLSSSPISRESVHVLVFNHRDDRSWRARELGEIALGIDADTVLVYGMSAGLASRLIHAFYRKRAMLGDVRRADVPLFPEIVSMREASADALLAVISRGAASRKYVDILCAGNIKGPGLALTESFAAMSRTGNAPCPASSASGAENTTPGSV